jgi:hypothetical protein
MTVIAPLQFDPVVTGVTAVTTPPTTVAVAVGITWQGFLLYPYPRRYTCVVDPYPLPPFATV